MRVGWGGEFLLCPTPLGTRSSDRLSRLYVAQIRDIPRSADVSTSLERRITQENPTDENSSRVNCRRQPTHMEREWEALCVRSVFRGWRYWRYHRTVCSNKGYTVLTRTYKENRRIPRFSVLVNLSRVNCRRKPTETTNDGRTEKLLYTVTCYFSENHSPGKFSYFRIQLSSQFNTSQL
jgi:hypothetical protein